MAWAARWLAHHMKANLREDRRGGLSELQQLQGTCRQAPTWHGVTGHPSFARTDSPGGYRRSTSLITAIMNFSWPSWSLEGGAPARPAIQSSPITWQRAGLEGIHEGWDAGLEVKGEIPS